MIDEQWSDVGAVCPYCGHVNKPEDDDYQLYDLSLDEYTCSICDKEFILKTDVSYSWKTRKKDD